MSKRKRMTVKQVMRFLNRSRSGLTSIADKLKPIPATNPTAEREYWKDEVHAFKAAYPVNEYKQRAGRISRRTKDPLTALAFFALSASLTEIPHGTGSNKLSANLKHNKG
jgi:hypothetical protein